MKTFQDKEITIAEQSFTYGALLTQCVNNPPQGGFAIEEIEARLRIIKSIKDAKDGTIKLEDADYEKALNCIELMRWGIMDASLVEFQKDVAAAV